MKAITLSQSDKRTLAVLGVFLVMAGYYQFVFEPVYTRWAAAHKAVKAKAKELKRMERKLREFRAIQRGRDELQAKVSLVAARVKMPPLGANQHDVLKAIMTAAARAGVKITNVRPMSAAMAEGDKGAITAFAVEGGATTEQFVAFMEKVWGMKVEELNLSPADDKERPVRFYTRLAPLPFAEIQHPPAEVRVSSFRLGQDPFLTAERGSLSPPYLRAGAGLMPPLPPPPPLPVSPAVSPAGSSFGSGGLRLVGITSVDGKAGAIVMDDSHGGKELYLEVGDRVNDFSVAAIDGKGITLRQQGARDARIEFAPRQGLDLPAVEDAPRAAPARSVASGKSGKLGIQVVNLSADPGKQKELGAKEGLVVVRGRGDAQEVKANDLITSINGIAVPSMVEARKIMQTIKAGDDLDLGVLSRGALKKVRIKAVE